MPWKVINQMDVKIALIKDWNAGHFNITDLSQKYMVTRPTVYKWLMRYKRFGIEGLKEHSRVPKRCPHRTSKEILDIIIEEKLRNRKRGPRKVRAQLKRKHPGLELPAVSTIGYWFKKEGLVRNVRSDYMFRHIRNPLADVMRLTIAGASITKVNFI